MSRETPPSLAARARTPLVAALPALILAGGPGAFVASRPAEAYGMGMCEH